MNKSYVICINNQDYQASLELRKIYELISDEDAAKKGFVRVIDESGEDYLYPRSYFVAVDLPQSVQLALAQAS